VWLAVVVSVPTPRSNTSEEPAISVRVAATSPPVQDSAAAILSLFARHRSSRVRACSISSRSAIGAAPRANSSLAPRQADGGGGKRRHAFAAAGKSHFLAGRRLHRDAPRRDPGELGNARAHCVAMPAGPLRLAHSAGVA